jgi:cell division protein FtsW
MRPLRRSKEKNSQATSKKQSSNVVLFIITLVLMSLGLIFVFEASSIRALNESGDSFFYLKLQFRWIMIGLFTMFILSKLPYKVFLNLSTFIIGFIFLSLIIVLIPSLGKTAGGARSWIDLGFFNFQPAEFAKSAVIIYLATWFFKRKKVSFLSFILFLGALIALVLLQPDMGTAIMLFTLGIGMYFVSGQALKPLLLLIPIIISGFLFLIVSAPYRLKRLTAFLRPNEDPLGVGFHINQILISITEGGVFGRGFGASRQKFLYLPEAHTDSIFAIISEELGFIGSILVLFLFFIMLYKIYKLYTVSIDPYAKMILSGIFIYFSLQIIINLGGMVNIMPLTGVTLPFISYGGSSMITSCLLMGIVFNISAQQKNV